MIPYWTGVAALMKLRSIFVFTHDSIGLGEDGPTHQYARDLYLALAQDTKDPVAEVALLGGRASDEKAASGARPSSSGSGAGRFLQSGSDVLSNAPRYESGPCRSAAVVVGWLRWGVASGRSCDVVFLRYICERFSCE